MKKAILTLAVVALVTTTAISKTDPNDRNSNSKISLSEVENGKFSLNMSTDEKGVIRLKITDEKGKLLISEKVSFNKSIMLPIDMSAMNEGTYTVKAESSSTSFEQRVFVSQLHHEDVAAFVKKIDERHLELKVFHENVPVSIKIVDNAGNIYYNNTTQSESNFIQKFDLSEIKETSTLEMIISGKKSTIYKSI